MWSFLVAKLNSKVFPFRFIRFFRLGSTWSQAPPTIVNFGRKLKKEAARHESHCLTTSVFCRCFFLLEQFFVNVPFGHAAVGGDFLHGFFAAEALGGVHLHVFFERHLVKRPPPLLFQLSPVRTSQYQHILAARLVLAVMRDGPFKRRR